MAINILVHNTGKVFNGEWKVLLDIGIKAAQQAVSEYGIEAIKNNLNDVIIENTGAYVSSIHSEWSSDDLAIHDNTVYGPWLEGLGSRNATSRFKGYWTFKETTQEIQSKSTMIALGAIAPFIEEINI